ncbi:MAG: peptidoglycan-binding protein [Pseudomonadota bacterium]
MKDFVERLRREREQHSMQPEGRSGDPQAFIGSPVIDATDTEYLVENPDVEASFDAETVFGGVAHTKKKDDAKKGTTLEDVIRFLAYLILVTLILGGLIWITYLAGKEAGADSVTTSPGYHEPVRWPRLAEWVDQTDDSFRDSAIKASSAHDGHTFDQVAVGLYFDKRLSDAQGAYYYLSLAAAQGSTPAFRLRQEVGATPNEKTNALTKLVDTLENGGREGNFRLGLLYLQDDAFELAQHPNTKYCLTDNEIEKKGLTQISNRDKAVPTWPPCEKNFQLPGAARLVFPNDILKQNYPEAFGGFQRAMRCGHEEAGRWVTAMRNAGKVSAAEAARIEAEAAEKVAKGGEIYCRGVPTPPPPTPQPRKVAQQSGGSSNPAAGAGAVAVRYCELGPRQGLQQAQRERPGRSGYNPANDASDAPICAPGSTIDPYCAESAEALKASDEARVCLRLGDAMLSAGDVDLALQYFRASIDRGRVYGAQASIIAGDRIRALSTTCEYSTASLANIARGAPGGRFIDLEHRQRALKALGYYNYAIDGTYGRRTREAVRSFQREIGFDETGALSSLETVLLICQAAQAKSDADSQNILGIMNAAGLGVVQNTDLALEWFERAMQRGSADAAYNLARVYATGTILSSYRLCDAPSNDARAKSYYDDARRLGHPGPASESFDQFRQRVQSENATGLELVGRSCGAPRKDAGDGQNE